MNKLSSILLVTFNLLIGLILLFTAAVKQFESLQINVLTYILGGIIISSISSIAIIYSTQKKNKHMRKFGF
ncbi:hypothetical protein [Sphingobacterium faecium]|uniref:hypothetical protein n=1 Tax=Sphingobacterium faecium TaxID=34087 RepID=UPI0024698563|nr:hypothetical protein [Sphingobacterium faecium]MDH5826681.1 hypothetical protein [Sphingobacterium faecium]